MSRNRTNSTPLGVSDLGEKPYVKPPTKPEKKYKIIYPNIIQKWAENIAKKLHATEEYVVRRQALLSRFRNVKSGKRDGAAIVDKAAGAFADLLMKRASAATAIMRKAEQLQSQTKAPKDYQFKYSYKLGDPKPKPKKPDSHDYYFVKLLTCRSQNYEVLHDSSHFDAKMSLNSSSVHVATEVFDCDPNVLQDMHWSEALDTVFRDNYHQDASLGFQYFCSAKGFLRHYPAASWESMQKLDLSLEQEDDEYQDNSPTGVYDCRLRPWYVSAGGAPRDILIMLDASGSMYNSSNKVIAEQFILALLSALTDDDHINVLRFNITVTPIIPCFGEDVLISANHINTAAIMASMKYLQFKNETDMAVVMTHAVRTLQEQREKPGRRRPCQQAIVLITDTLNENMTELIQLLDPDGLIRLYVIWLHDPFGVRDSTRDYSLHLSCSRDGYFAELTTHADVTEQVLRLLRVLERPLVAQRKERLTVFSDVYAHVEDPRRSEVHWIEKENVEQRDRYFALRRDKKKLLDPAQLMKDYMHSVRLDQYGQYYESMYGHGYSMDNTIDVDYRLQISVSVPVFENTMSENVTITLAEELHRISTRTYPVNRLLGVAGVDIPIDHLKLVLPFYQVGAGGTLFIVDHRGNIVLHENLKPTFDGDILKPGYRTVDFLDLEQEAESHVPRPYPEKWIKFRSRVLINSTKGTETHAGKYIFEQGMRALIEEREYHWRRVHDHYTVVAVLPRHRQPHVVPTATKFTQKMAQEAVKALSDPDFVVHPDWLYCQYIHKKFDSPKSELLEFLGRRRHEPNFPMKRLQHVFSPFLDGNGDLESTYQCDEELVARVCSDAIASEAWASRQDGPDVSCTECYFGSVTAFIATESGLTRWQHWHVTGSVKPPDGALWARGPDEPWYIRAAAAPGTLIVHAPVAPIRLRRTTMTDAVPPALGEQSKWLTAARVLELQRENESEKAVVGVVGYHFHPQYMRDVLKEFTDFDYTPDDDPLHTTCDGIYWLCLLVDDEGWVVAANGDTYEDMESHDVPLRRHLATLYPAAMTVLLKQKVFDLNWIHDYQAVCFPPAEEEISAGPIMPSILRSVWHATKAVVRVASEALLIVAVSTYGTLVSSETAFEKEKRRRATKKSFEREAFDRLFDERVLVNRTRIAACDRSRPLYVLNRARALKAFNRPVDEANCAWPIAGALLPRTNLLLLALFKPCMEESVPTPLPDPMINQKVATEDDEEPKTVPSAALLACARNVVPLPTRPPHTACFPHRYQEEEGYRQCGPWLPDDEQPDEDSAYDTNISRMLLFLAVSVWLVV
ncbi:voltage-dependent calcium channel subunit alpha-2/delta-1-like [Leguminivora glycinivorella]|uniref:voltage-dependent calcium channel subunit alpha-2/delta-1-like n=1 Tax=Leguminivora glycinivorella TaxID=1035111 RepID=UPI00200FE3EF|nr:voltage-dependent calcium channel subunit alpha-2/delta-1-like [Leguminivora glycinivorella]